jgi:putative two-component system response regulator
MLLEAAPMHDIGKVGIPDHILLKPGRLDVAEFEIMKRHSILGYEILHGSQSAMLQAAAQIALGHHEKFDGSGYPYGLKGEEIPLFARICAVGDVFDALTSERPYKKAWEDDRAVALLRDGMGSHFDPACVEAFLEDWDAVLAIRNRFVDDETEKEGHKLGGY